MATTKPKPAVKATAGSGFSPDLLAAIANVGETQEVRFKLHQIKLSDGQYHKLSKPYSILIKWDSAVGVYVAYDMKYLSAGQASTPARALEEYFIRVRSRIDWLLEDEAVLGKPLLEELAELRNLFTFTSLNAN